MMYTIIVLYKLKELSAEQKERTKEEWEKLRKEFGKYGVKLVSDNSHAFGTYWNGFLVLEAENFDKYVEFWKWLKEKIRWYIESTMTIIGVKRE